MRSLDQFEQRQVIATVNRAITRLGNAEAIGDWTWDSSLFPKVSKSVRDAVESRLRAMGYEVRRQITLKSGQRPRGFWVRGGVDIKW